jgi:hypothetical protein
MARTPITNSLLKELVKEALAPAGGTGSVKDSIQSLVGVIGEKLKGQYDPAAVENEMKELATQIEAMIRSSVAKLKSSKQAPGPTA